MPQKTKQELENEELLKDANSTLTPTQVGTAATGVTAGGTAAALAKNFGQGSRKTIGGMRINAKPAAGAVSKTLTKYGLKPTGVGGFVRSAAGSAVRGGIGRGIDMLTKDTEEDTAKKVVKFAKMNGDDISYDDALRMVQEAGDPYANSGVGPVFGWSPTSLLGDKVRGVADVAFGGNTEANQGSYGTDRAILESVTGVGGLIARMINNRIESYGYDSHAKMLADVYHSDKAMSGIQAAAVRNALQFIGYDPEAGYDKKTDTQMKALALDMAKDWYPMVFDKNFDPKKRELNADGSIKYKFGRPPVEPDEPVATPTTTSARQNVADEPQILEDLNQQRLTLADNVNNPQFYLGQGYSQEQSDRMMAEDRAELDRVISTIDSGNALPMDQYYAQLAASNNAADAASYAKEAVESEKQRKARLFMPDYGPAVGQAPQQRPVRVDNAGGPVPKGTYWSNYHGKYMPLDDQSIQVNQPYNPPADPSQIQRGVEASDNSYDVQDEGVEQFAMGDSSPHGPEEPIIQYNSTTSSGTAGPTGPAGTAGPSGGATATNPIPDQALRQYMALDPDRRWMLKDARTIDNVQFNKDIENYLIKHYGHDRAMMDHMRGQLYMAQANNGITREEYDREANVPKRNYLGSTTGTSPNPTISGGVITGGVKPPSVTDGVVANANKDLEDKIQRQKLATQLRDTRYGLSPKASEQWGTWGLDGQRGSGPMPARLFDEMLNRDAADPNSALNKAMISHNAGRAPNPYVLTPAEKQRGGDEGVALAAKWLRLGTITPEQMPSQEKFSWNTNNQSDYFDRSSKSGFFSGEESIRARQADSMVRAGNSIASGVRDFMSNNTIGRMVSQSLFGNQATPQQASQPAAQEPRQGMTRNWGVLNYPSMTPRPSTTQPTISGYKFLSEQPEMLKPRRQ